MCAERAEGKRDYSKTDYCFYCEKELFSKISKHYLQVHTDRGLVKEIVVSKGKLRLQLMHKLQQLGNYKHNTRVRSLNYKTLQMHIKCMSCGALLYGMAAVPFN